MRSYGKITCRATCEKCGAEVTFVYEWDRSVNWAGYSTEHYRPGTEEVCELSEAQADKAISEAGDTGPEREYVEDR